MKWYDWLGLGWYSLLAVISAALAVTFYMATPLIGAWGVSGGIIFTLFTALFVMTCWSIIDLKHWDR